MEPGAGLAADPSLGGVVGAAVRAPGSGEGPGPTRSGLSRSEAERILASVERAEHTVRAEQTRRRRVAGSAAAKDW
jgi:hypothetical protein